MLQNYPNPFNPTTTIRYHLPVDGFVTLMVFDALGRQLQTLVSKEMSVGTHEFNWEASGLASGVYLCRLQMTPADNRAAAVHATTRLVLLRWDDGTCEPVVGIDSVRAEYPPGLAGSNFSIMKFRA